MTKTREFHAVLVFALLSCLFSWPFFFCADAWLEPMFSAQGNAEAARYAVLAGHILGMLGPALAALFMWRAYHKESPPAWKWSSPRYYLFAALAMLAFWGLPALIGLAFGDSLRSPIESGIWIRIAVLAVFGWIAGMGEETGWCAYVLPKLSGAAGKTRAAIVSSVIRGLWHWPVVVSPVIAQVAAGQRTVPELIGAGVVIALQLVVSNFFFGPIFCWVWYKTESVPLTGWLHFWFDFVRDAAVMLLVGFGTGAWATQWNAFILLPAGFMFLSTILDDEGSGWRRFLGIGKSSLSK